jgi:hypothetical protein
VRSSMKKNVRNHPANKPGKRAEITSNMTDAQALEVIKSRAGDHSKYDYNPCLMRKCDVRIGTVFRNIGRSRGADGQRFYVKEIQTGWNLHGRVKMIPVDQVVKLSDILLLVSIDGPAGKPVEVHRVRFQTLEYSATWWLDPDQPKA